MKKSIALAALFSLTSTLAFAQATMPSSNPLRRPAPAATQPAATPAPAAEAPAAAKPKRTSEKSTGDFKARRTQCSSEWKAAKAANKTNGQKWPQFFSACNTRLKAQGV